MLPRYRKAKIVYFCFLSALFGVFFAGMGIRGENWFLSTALVTFMFYGCSGA